MEFLSRVWASLADDRLLFNSVVAFALLAFSLIALVVVRHFLTRLASQLAEQTGWLWLRGMSQRLGVGFFWLTLGCIALIVLGMPAITWPAATSATTCVCFSRT